MENSNDTIKILRDTDATIKPFRSRNSIDICEEWIKWLSYVPDFKIDGIEEQIKMNKLFEKYLTKE